jgi:dihydrofolate reductase
MWVQMVSSNRGEDNGVRNLVVTQNITLDGSIEMLTDWFDAQGSFDDMADVREEMHRQDADSDGLVLGRRTFEDFRGYWPHVVDDTTGISESLNRTRKYVVSSTLTDPEWQNSTILAGDPVASVGALKRQQGNDLVVTGSIRLTHALVAAGLVEEFRLFVYPTVQGRGRGLFPEGHEIRSLRHLESRVFRSGITLQRYAAA